MSRGSRWEYFKAIYTRYRQAERRLKHVILNEFCLNTRYNRKYAIRLLNGPVPDRVRRRTPRPHPPTYGPAVVSVLAALREAAGYPWSLRLKALLPLWMPCVRKRFRPSPEVERPLGRISSRQINRRLRARKTQWKTSEFGFSANPYRGWNWLWSALRCRQAASYMRVWSRP